MEATDNVELKMNTQTLGLRGENLAAQYLKEKDYIILETNWHCRLGEIDIVAQTGATYVFCEVKTRRGKNVQDALVAITLKKRQRFVKAVYHYLNEHGLEDVLWRIDAIGIALPPQGKPIIEHVEDALDW